jgi:hypothetical protein
MAKLEVGDKVTLNDGTKGTFQGMTGSQRNRRAVIETSEGKVTTRISNIKGQSGQLSQAQASGAPGTGRKPMKPSTYAKLRDKGVIADSPRSGKRRMAGAASVIDEAFIEDGGKYAQGGFVRVKRKGSFKGIF